MKNMMKSTNTMLFMQGSMYYIGSPIPPPPLFNTYHICFPLADKILGVFFI